jgi:hypothetical protein
MKAPRSPELLEILVRLGNQNALATRSQEMGEERRERQPQDQDTSSIGCSQLPMMMRVDD